jgi:hypothetical protein
MGRRAVIWVFSVLLYLISGAAFFPLGWMHDVPWQVFPFSLFVLVRPRLQRHKTTQDDTQHDTQHELKLVSTLQLLVVILAQQIKADCWLVRRPSKNRCFLHSSQS